MTSEIIKILEHHNVKPTAMRMLVLEHMLLNKKHMSLSEIETILYPADRITIYRTLQTFVKNGIAHTVDTSNNGAAYGLCPDGCTNDMHTDEHPHFVCEKCNNITCSNDFIYTIRRNNQACDYTINKVEVIIKGVCPACRGK